MQEPQANERLFPILYTQLGLFLDNDEQITQSQSVGRVIDQGNLTPENAEEFIQHALICMFDNAPQDVYDEWLPTFGKLAAMLSESAFETIVLSKIKQLTDFKQSVKNKSKGLELLGNTILYLDEQRIMKNFSTLIESLCQEVNWGIRQ